ncbi:transposable element Tcb1 transposase [Elysia marginata]|uniref:Transposable element Tcb1 transposase n=1 Tax=Elysia marginata TaxID=1093978 RepID=A0AAV4JUE7_9GAST|nr:transposable element Tcb1 transposase [Elysia marginata]
MGGLGALRGGKTETLLEIIMTNTLLSGSASSRQTRGRNSQRLRANTVRRRLSTSGLRARRPYIGPILTQHHRQQRTLLAQEHAAWNCIQWRSVVFSDESRFCIDHADGLVCVWRRSGERYQVDCVREHDRWAGASLIMSALSLTMIGLGQFFPQYKGDKCANLRARLTFFRLTWCLTPPCIEILFFNKTTQ